jgi:hypothetical protein
MSEVKYPPTRKSGREFMVWFFLGLNALAMTVFCIAFSVYEISRNPAVLEFWGIGVLCIFFTLWLVGFAKYTYRGWKGGFSMNVEGLQAYGKSLPWDHIEDILTNPGGEDFYVRYTDSDHETVVVPVEKTRIADLDKFFGDLKERGMTVREESYDEGQKE